MQGEDSQGRKYETREEMWAVEAAQGSDLHSKEGWYGKAIDYWASVPPTVDGVLGGFGHVTTLDMAESAGFLIKCKRVGVQWGEGSGSVVDCGAGVGRISQGLLTKHFGTVDVLEPVPQLICQAKQSLADHPNVRDFLEIGLEAFAPQEQAYNCIWIQWCIGHLTDDDLVALLQRCSRALRPGGAIIIKENICNEEFIVDKEDSSVTRSERLFEMLFAKAGLNIVNSDWQRRWEQGLFRVRMYCLQPSAN